MRIVREIAHPQCKISIFSWNNKYLIKIEQGSLEQTFKIDQTNILEENDLLKIVDAEFIQHALDRFVDMHRSLNQAVERSEG